MHYTLIILITIAALVAIYFAHPARDVGLAQKRNLTLEGIIVQLNELIDVKGNTGTAKGAKVTMSLYNDKININNELVIPLDKLKNAKTFNVKQITLTNSSGVGQNRQKWSRFKRMCFLFGCFTGLSMPGTSASVNTFLTLEFTDELGQDIKGLFLATNGQVVKKFVEAVNNQIGTAANGHVLT